MTKIISAIDRPIVNEKKCLFGESLQKAVKDLRNFPQRIAFIKTKTEIPLHLV